MLSHRFTRRFHTVVIVMATVLAAGCAANGVGPGQTSSQRTKSADGTAPVAQAPSATLALYEQATAVMAAGDYLAAERRFGEFLSRYPDYAGAHVNLAIIHTHGSDDDAAQAELSAALKLNPDHAGAWNQQGILHRRNGQFAEAEAAYLKAVTANPDYALAHYNLGVLNELYLQRLDVALHHYVAYQALVSDDERVEKWIADLRRRTAAAGRTANVAD